MLRVSVIIPAYNCTGFIKQTLESVLIQTYKDFEIIVVDDGSTDNTEEILKSFGNKIRYVKQKNSGVSSARNRAISLAKGEYIALLDHDDLWLVDKLEKQMKLFEYPRYDNLGIVFSDCFLDNKKTGKTDTLFRGIKPYRGSVLKELVLNNFIPCLTAIIPSRVISEAGMFSGDLCIAEEYELFLKIAEKHTVDYVDEPLARYTIHDTNFSRNILLGFEESKRVLSTVITRNPSLKEELEKTLSKNLSGIERNIGLKHLSDGNAIEGRKNIISSLKLRFSIPTVIWLIFSYLGKPGVFFVKLLRSLSAIIIKKSVWRV